MANLRLPTAPNEYSQTRMQAILNELERIISSPNLYARKVQRITSASFDVSGDSAILMADYTATGAVTINLGSALQWAGRSVVVADSGSNASINNITLHPPSGSNITISTDDEVVTVFSDGTGWLVESRS